ncbi:MAG: alpha/beta hydrolase [Lachnospiraceae bacterium]|nr:alpha/beta hydrolase [Lachnospiraceae bacterium]
MNKIAVFFPGIGYTNDRPLLYYSAYTLKRKGYHLIKLDFTGFPDGVFNDEKKMMKCFELALNQAGDELKSVSFNNADDILFVSKSLGTSVAAFYASKHNLPVRHIFFTPLENTLSLVKPGSAGIAFSGTNDPWADYEKIRTACDRRKIHITLVKDANHSLETGEFTADIGILSEIMHSIDEFTGL